MNGKAEPQESNGENEGKKTSGNETLPPGVGAELGLETGPGDRGKTGPDAGGDTGRETRGETGLYTGGETGLDTGGESGLEAGGEKEPEIGLETRGETGVEAGGETGLDTETGIDTAWETAGETGLDETGLETRPGGRGENEPGSVEDTSLEEAGERGQGQGQGETELPGAAAGLDGACGDDSTGLLGKGGVTGSNSSGGDGDSMLGVKTGEDVSCGNAKEENGNGGVSDNKDDKKDDDKRESSVEEGVVGDKGAGQSNGGQEGKPDGGGSQGRIEPLGGKRKDEEGTRNLRDDGPR